MEIGYSFLGEKMKVTIIPPYTNTGESQYSNYLIKGLKKNMVEVNILQNKYFKNPNIKILFGSFLLKNILNKNVDIIHNLDNLGPYLIKHKYENKKVNYVQTVHDIAPVIYPQLYNQLVKFDFKIILPRILMNCDLIIAASYSTKKDLIRTFGIDKNKIIVIHLGVDTSFFYPRTGTESCLKKYGIKDKYLLYVGTDNPRKNLTKLIISFIKLSKDIPHNLVLVGPIDKNKILKILSEYCYTESLKNNLLKRIIILGYIDYDDLPIIYSSASEFIFPSLYEGFGLPILEAMACSVPVVVSKNSSLPELVGDAGVYIEDPLNIDDIYYAVLKNLDNDTALLRLKEKGLDRAKKFSWEQTINKTIGIYNKI
jgi:glycosyltransferase involved in cell wall biosynthesis